MFVMNAPVRHVVYKRIIEQKTFPIEMVVGEEGTMKFVLLQQLWMVYPISTTIRRSALRHPALGGTAVPTTQSTLDIMVVVQELEIVVSEVRKVPIQ